MPQCSISDLPVAKFIFIFSVPVPKHWSQKRKFLQGKRGIEKPPFALPCMSVPSVRFVPCPRVCNSAGHVRGLVHGARTSRRGRGGVVCTCGMRVYQGGPRMVTGWSLKPISFLPPPRLCGTSQVHHAPTTPVHGCNHTSPLYTGVPCPYHPGARGCNGRARFGRQAAARPAAESLRCSLVETNRATAELFRWDVHHGRY